MEQDPADTCIIYFTNLKKGMKLKTVCENLQRWLYGKAKENMDFRGGDLDPDEWGEGKVQNDRLIKRHVTPQTKSVIERKMRTGATFFVGNNTQVTIVCVHIYDLIVAQFEILFVVFVFVFIFVSHSK